MRTTSLFLGSVAAVVLSVQSVAASAQGSDKPGSLHLQCDGQPNNMTGGETAARLLGAVTLLGLFAPPPETADSSKRKKGAEGIAACSALIDGDRAEGNAKRRIGLILARAIHQIEAKNLPAALADVGKARAEAQAAGLMNDLFYARSRGRSFDALEAAILMRMGKSAEARDAGLRSARLFPYTFLAQVGASAYAPYNRQPSPLELDVAATQGKLYNVFAFSHAARLEEAGRFADAATIYDALAEVDRVNTPKLVASGVIALSAIAHAMAGNWTEAEARLATAKANSARRKADGDPEQGASEVVEMIDFLSIARLAKDGDLAQARRMFGARSQWSAPSLGSVIALTDRLRAGAPAADLTGALAKSGDQLWSERGEELRAQLVAKDDDGMALYGLIPGELSGSALRAVSKIVWDTDKSRMIFKSKSDNDSSYELMFNVSTNGIHGMDAYLLHAALMAQSRGHQGFIFDPVVAKGIVGASFRTGNRGTSGMPDSVFIEAAPVIAALRPVIPSPADIKAEQRAAR